METITPITYLGKTVGHTEGKTYVTIRRPEHFFRKYNGFGMSTQLLKILKNHGVAWIWVRYEKTDGSTSNYLAALEDFYAHGIPYTDRSVDTQLILPLTHFGRK